MKTSGARHFATKSLLSKIDSLFGGILLASCTLLTMGGMVAMVLARVPVAG